MTFTVAVDFDGVIHSYDRGWHDGTIYGDFVEGAEEGLAELMKSYAVFILTSRKPRQVAKWMSLNSKIPVTLRVPRNGFWGRQDSVLVTNQKLPAIAYLDDRAVPFCGWDNVPNDIPGS